MTTTRLKTWTQLAPCPHLERCGPMSALGTVLAASSDAMRWERALQSSSASRSTICRWPILSSVVSALRRNAATLGTILAAGAVLQTSCTAIRDGAQWWISQVQQAMPKASRGEIYNQGEAIAAINLRATTGLEHSPIPWLIQGAHRHYQPLNLVFLSATVYHKPFTTNIHL